MKRVLLTGATGFVGSHIAEALLKADYGVRCTLRAKSSTRWLEGLDVERIIVDFGESGSLRRVAEGVDAVIHAAGLTRAKDPEAYTRVNSEGTKRLAEAAAAAGVARFVLISSLAARGPDAETPTGDHPTSDYGRSKLEAERKLHALKGLESISLRLAAVYGPRDKDLLPLFQMAHRGFLTLPSASGALQPLFVEDAAAATLAALEGSAPFGPFDVAEQGRYGWDEVARGLEGALGRSVRVVKLPHAVFAFAGRAAERAATLTESQPAFDKRRADDLARHTWTCDPTPTERALGWKAEVALPEGLERTARWYRAQGWL